MRRVVCGALIVLALVGCSPGNRHSDQSQVRGSALTEAAMRSAEKAVPYPLPQLTKGGWLERDNLRERLVRYSDPDKISYIYLLSDIGTVVSHYTIKGKVSSNQSNMTTTTLWSRFWGDVFQSDAPNDEGSYGPNEDGIFFFTTSDVMKTWNGKYQLSDAPMTLVAPPILTYDPQAKPTSSAR